MLIEFAWYSWTSVLDELRLLAPSILLLSLLQDHHHSYLTLSEYMKEVDAKSKSVTATKP